MTIKNELSLQSLNMPSKVAAYNLKNDCERIVQMGMKGAPPNFKQPNQVTPANIKKAWDCIIAGYESVKNFKTGSLEWSTAWRLFAHEKIKLSLDDDFYSNRLHFYHETESSAAVRYVSLSIPFHMLCNEIKNKERRIAARSLSQFIASNLNSLELVD